MIPEFVTFRIQVIPCAGTLQDDMQFIVTYQQPAALFQHVFHGNHQVSTPMEGSAVGNVCTHSPSWNAVSPK